MAQRSRESVYRSGNSKLGCLGALLRSAGAFVAIWLFAIFDHEIGRLMILVAIGIWLKLEEWNRIRR